MTVISGSGEKNWENFIFAVVVEKKVTQPLSVAVEMSVWCNFITDMCWQLKDEKVFESVFTVISSVSVGLFILLKINLFRCNGKNYRWL